MIAQDTTTFPAYLLDVQELVEYHNQLEDETLLLAVYYAPERSPNDAFLFEVYDGYHQNRIGPERDFEEISYGSTEAFPLGREQRLHIVLTNPVEFEVGLRENWPMTNEIRKAAQEGKSQVIYVAPAHEALAEKLRG